MGIGAVTLFRLQKRPGRHHEKSRIELLDFNGHKLWEAEKKDKKPTWKSWYLMTTVPTSARTQSYFHFLCSRWGAMILIKKAKNALKGTKNRTTKTFEVFLSSKHSPATPKFPCWCWGWWIFLGAQPHPRNHHLQPRHVVWMTFHGNGFAQGYGLCIHGGELAVGR